MFEKFTEDAVLATMLAVEEAFQLGDEYVGTEHLLIGLILPRSANTCRLFEKHAVSAEQVRTKLAEIMQRQTTQRSNQNMLMAFERKRTYSPRLLRVMELCNRSESVSARNLLSGIIQEADENGTDGHAYRTLKELKLDLAVLKSDLQGN